jgi:hypothetical protein
MDDRYLPAVMEGNGRIRLGRSARRRSGGSLGRADCLQQLLLAFRDIADRDDIHQAAARLAVVQEWIRDEAERAALDSIFAKQQPV